MVPEAARSALTPAPHKREWRVNNNQGVGRVPPSKQIAALVAGALRAFAICAPIAPLGIETGAAQEAGSGILTADIPAQPLDRALAEFARQTGLQFVYVSSLVRDRNSHAAALGLSAQSALTQLLQNTGLRFEFLTARSVRILATKGQETEAQGLPGGRPHEVVIRADRREEKFQDVPATIQTLTADDISKLGLTTFNDLMHYTPNVTFSGNGPGTGNIFIRGVGFVGTGNQSQATAAPFPNVALYLDNQSMQFPGRNNDVYLVDMARVEVLEGPQSTQFGGGAQAGVVRYVTNKPNVAGTSGQFSVGYGITTGGDPNSNLSAILNLPLVPDRLAVRAVVFSDQRGGYVANVFGTIGFPHGSVPAVSGGNPVATNATLVGANTNPVTYSGLRLSVLLQVSDDWNLLIQQNYQDMRADGYFYAYPSNPEGAPLQPYQITAFTPAYNKDRYESTAWTLNGRVGDLSAVYTGSYLVRHIEGQQDYSNYLRSQSGAYYACIGPGAGFFNPSNFPSLAHKSLQCYAPVGDWLDIVQHEHESHELRINSNEGYRIRGLVGAYWEKFVINDNMNFNYLDIPQCSSANLAVAQAGGADCLSAVGPAPGTLASDPSLRENMNDAFGQDAQRGYRQLAFFASLDLDLVPNVLILSAGLRHYHYDEFEHGSEWYTETTSPLILNHANGACTAAAVFCGFPINLDKTESGFRARGNLTWRITPDSSGYYSFSQGYRPGGFNRVPSASGQTLYPAPEVPYCGAASTDSRCLPGGNLYNRNSYQYLRPAGYQSDRLTSNELGLKSEFLDHRLLVNASVYQMAWSNAQSQVLFGSPDADTYATFVANGPSYRIRGFELQLGARVTDGLTLQGSGSWNSVSQASNPCLRSAGVTPFTLNNPTPAGQCITVFGGLPYSSPWGATGTSAPYAPADMFSVRARYEWNVFFLKAFALIGANHIGSMSNAPANFPDGAAAQNPPATTLLRYAIPAYTSYDAAFGIRKENWSAEMIGSNLGNAYAATNVSAGQFIKAEIPLRPRVLVAQLTYRF
jgi:iron complex outermembrane recepter protein